MKLVFRGCWTVPLLALVLLLTPVPSSAEHGASGTNTTELGRPANVTDPPNKEDDAITMVTGVTSSAAPDPMRAGRVPRAGDEEQSSGMFPGAAVVQEEITGPQLSEDSAETELLLPKVPLKPDLEEEPWIHSTQVPVSELDRTTTMQPPAPPTNPDVFHVDFFDAFSPGRSLDLAPPATSSLAHELQGGDPTSWALPDNYDYLTPYEDGVSPTADEYAYSTTTDAYESDEDLRLAAAPPARSRPWGPGAAGSNVAAAAPPAAVAVNGSNGSGGCQVGYQMVNGSCRSPCNMSPNFCFNGGQCFLLQGTGVFCRCNVQDYMWIRGSRCEVVVTEFQVLCLMVSALVVVLFLLFMIVVCFAKKLHLLKTQNKKLRQRSSKLQSSEQHNDNFSLSTIAEGSHPNVRKLCDSPPVVPHARSLAYYDNIICQNKLEDPVKTPPPVDDPLNIHNSLTPKHENHKVVGEENSSENSLQNNMM